MYRYFKKVSLLTLSFLITGCGYNVNSSLYPDNSKVIVENKGISCIKSNRDFIHETATEDEKTIYGITMFYFGIAKVDINNNNCNYVYKVYKKTFIDNDIKAIFSNDFTKESFIKSQDKNFGATIYKLAIAEKNNDNYNIVWEGIYQNDLKKQTNIGPDFDKYNNNDSDVVKELVNSFFKDTKSNNYAGVNWTKELTTGIIEVALTHQIGKSVNSIYDANTAPSFNSPNILK